MNKLMIDKRKVKNRVRWRRKNDTRREKGVEWQNEEHREKKERKKEKIAKVQRTIKEKEIEKKKPKMKSKERKRKRRHLK